MKRGRKSMTEKIQEESKRVKRRLGMLTAQPILVKQSDDPKPESSQPEFVPV